MHNVFPYKKFVKVNISDIIWEDSYENELYLPSTVQNYEVEVDEDVDPRERWCENGCQSGYEILCETIANQLSNEYGCCIADVEGVEVID